MFKAHGGGIKTTSAGITYLINGMISKRMMQGAGNGRNKPRIRNINGNSSYPVISFEYAANAVKKLTHSSILTNDYTAIYIHKPYSATGSRTIHTGNVTGGKLGIYARSATTNRGTGLFDGTNLRFSNENPIEEKWRIDTYQPAKIYKDGTEVDVKHNKRRTYNDREGMLHTILGVLQFFNKTISDEIRLLLKPFKTKLPISQSYINQLD